MNVLEEITEKIHRAYFVDLFVRVSNATAIQMYNQVSLLQATCISGRSSWMLTTCTGTPWCTICL